MMDHIDQHCCKHCGETDSIVLCFHHRNPKEKLFRLVWAYLHYYSIETMKKEAEKCDVCCSHCGTKDIRILTFHHLQDKAFTISKKLLCLDLQALTEEAAKCDVMCINCHQKLHAAGIADPSNCDHESD
jgi:hypothetical protein